MKYFLYVLIACCVLVTTSNATTQTGLELIKPKIVGGELASQDQWPWMSALVSTYNDISTSLELSGIEYKTTYFTNGPAGTVSALLVDCGIGDNQCEQTTNKICLIARGEVDFSVKVNNCQAGGGIGAIIFNNVTGHLNGTLGEDFTGNIPVVGISQLDGAALLNQLNSMATIAVAAQSTLVQSSSCGASFIGEKWLITAAHCLEDANINFLKVNVGEYDLSNGANNAKAIRRIYIHPNYNDGIAFDNDIALIELVDTIVHPAVTLVDLDTSRQLALVNSAATVIGWGNRTAYGASDEPPANDQPDKLHQVELTLLSNELCKEKLAQAYSVFQNANILPEQVGLTDSMICANYLGGGKGSCQGDSGGPLLVNTNLGWQQIGIVSYGIGCASADFPGVYARVGKFTQWINNITTGIAIDPIHVFAITPQNTAQTTSLTVSNNSDFTANLTFTLLTDSTSSGFSVDSDECTTLAAKQSCQLQVDFDAATSGQHNAQIIIQSNDINIPTSHAVISAEAIAANSAINTQLSNGSTELLWFSGGDQPWLLDNTESAIISGDINDNQQSAVLLTFSGAGSLSFEWSVSAEENTDNPDEPYDGLFLFVDGKQVNFISGEVPYTPVTLADLTASDHQILWLYQKDDLTSAGKDQGALRNVVFTPTAIIPPPPATTPTTKKSGGSIGYLSLLIFALLPFRYRAVKNSR
ncbi:trypsin-like serine protease [Colwellia piezophila]|uniref:trypsin-like serine protease n=1 Tax=Colwellia piezophila TaxID=211668 RepID=UPI000367D12F|nr:trypsin-like serine protease [Colwellia piezophila]